MLSGIFTSKSTSKSSITPYQNNSKTSKKRLTIVPNGILGSPLETVGVPESTCWVPSAEISRFRSHFGPPGRAQNPLKIEEILKKTASGRLRKGTRKAARRKIRKTSVSEGPHPHETLRIQAKSKVFHFCRESSFGLIFHSILDPF